MIEKILERLEAEKAKGHYDFNSVIGEKNVWQKAIEIVQEVAKEYTSKLIIDCADMAKIDEIARAVKNMKVMPMQTDGGWIPCSERLPELVKNKYRVAFEHIVNCDRDASYLSDAYRNDLTDLLELINKYESNGWIPVETALPTDCDHRFYECIVENHEEDLPMFCQYEEEYGFGFWNDYYDEHTLGFVDSEFETNEELGYEKVIAWKQIEPYKRGA